MEKSTEEIKNFPKNVNLIAADNGYLVEIGCQLFVVEGSTSELVRDLEKYLNCDGDIIKKFLYKGDDVFHLPRETRMVEACMEKPYKKASKSSPAFEYLKDTDSKASLITSTFSATNGTITVNYEDKTVTITQKLAK